MDHWLCQFSLHRAGWETVCRTALVNVNFHLARLWVQDELAMEMDAGGCGEWVLEIDLGVSAGGQ